VSEDRFSRPFDAGLQPERTALAWRRTALALIVGALVGIRILPAILGPWALVPAGGGLLLALLVLVQSHHRYRTQHRVLTTSRTDRIPLPDGRLPALVAVAALLAGAAALLVVVTSR
jgi:putative membrane protein